MRKFVGASQVLSDVAVEGDIKETKSSHEMLLKMVNLRQKEVITGFDLEFDFEKILSLATPYPLKEEEHDDVLKLFQELYSGTDVRVDVYSKKITWVEMFNEVLAINKYRGNDSPYSKVIAFNPDD